jgi:hypothetical protein
MEANAVISLIKFKNFRSFVSAFFSVLFLNTLKNVT